MARCSWVMPPFFDLQAGLSRVRRRGPRVGKWETCVWFSTFPSAARPSCGNVGISRCRRDSQGAVGRVGNLPLVFHAFLRPVISTAPAPSRFRAWFHFLPRHWANKASLARCIRCAASVSLMRRESRSNSSAVMPSFKYFSQSGRETNFSYGVR